MSQPSYTPKARSGGIAAVGAGLILGSAALMTFLDKWEPAPGAARLTVYADKLAGNLPTVCRGLTKHVTTTPIVIGEVWTEAKCDREERIAVVKLQKRLLTCFKLNPPQSVFDMATSHGWNLGASATCGSSAMKAWNMGEWRLGCRRLQMSDGGKLIWSYVRTGRIVDGKPEYKFVRGLANRRADERSTCEAGL